MAADTPLVSVVITTYNRDYCIGEAVKSILAQTYQNFEILLIDDGSDDNTKAVVHSLNDARIKYHRLAQNCQMSLAANIGLSMAKGELIARLDSDDTWLPDKLEKQVSYLAMHPECGACFTHVQFSPEPEGPVKPWWYTAFEAENRPRAQWLHDFYFNGNCLCHTSIVFRRDILRQIGFYDCSLLPLYDFDLWVKLLKQTDIYILPERLTMVHWADGVESDNVTTATDLASQLRVTYEMAYVRAHYFDGMDDALFCEAFRGEFIRPDANTHEELECEQAFLLLKKPEGTPLLHHQAGAERLAALLNQESTRNILQEKYAFTPKDYYAITGTPFWGVPISFQQALSSAVEEAEQLRVRIKAAEDHAAFLKQQVEEINHQLTHLNNHADELQKQADRWKEQYEKICQSISWRITKPLRAIGRALRGK